MDRIAAAQEFLANTDWANAAMQPLAGDASARRYFRLTGTGGTAILMDAPPGIGQDIRSFLAVAGHLRDNGLSAPEIFASDQVAGFILMEDFGDGMFARLMAESAREIELYGHAVDVLVLLDALPAPEFVPDLEARMMARQISPALDWYACGITGADKCRDCGLYDVLETVLKASATRRQTMLLRDYHAENLIWLPGRSGTSAVGLLDFQDAMAGPPGYDLVSLLQDARRDVPEDIEHAMINRFVSATGRDIDTFSLAYAAIGTQRNLRILGVFARLAILHGKPRYLRFIPRVWGYVQRNLAHPGLASVARIVTGVLPEPTECNLQTLRDKCPTAPL